MNLNYFRICYAFSCFYSFVRNESQRLVTTFDFHNREESVFFELCLMFFRVRQLFLSSVRIKSHSFSCVIRNLINRIIAI